MKNNKKLKHFQYEKFNQKGLKHEEINLMHYFKFLDNVLPNAFPTEDELRDIIKKIETNKPKSSNFYSQDFLPTHITDRHWWIKYLMQVIKNVTRTNKENDQHIIEIGKMVDSNYAACGIKPEKEETFFNFEQPTINSGIVSKYIGNSRNFKRERADYELSIVGAVIRYCIENNLPKLNDEQRKNADRRFRQFIYKKLVQDYKLHSNIVEKGIEKYAKVWKERTMQDAYYSRYSMVGKIQSFDDATNLFREREKNKKHWIALRMITDTQIHAEGIEYANAADYYPQFTPEELAASQASVDEFDKLFNTLTKPSVQKIDGRTSE